MRTQVGIIGGGPAGLLLSQILHRAGVETVVVERHAREHVLQRIGASVLESGLCTLLREAGVGDRLDRAGFVHRGMVVAGEDRAFRIDLAALTGRTVTVYGQSELTRDLYEAHDVRDAAVLHGVEGTAVEGADTESPVLALRHKGRDLRIACDFVVGCDGLYGVSRQTIPAAARREVETVYPFGWLGVLSHTPPVHDELIHAGHPRGFAFCSMRGETLSRYYIQVPAEDRVEAWSDQRFWDELRRRIPPETAEALVTGPSIEKSIAPLRGFVSEPMRWGRLLLAGDAAHIVPPTGAKGLNLAASDVFYLSRALIAHYRGDGPELLDRYSADALARVWKALRFSCWMTRTLHRFPGDGPFEERMQAAELGCLEESEAAQRALAENYVGLPY